MNGEKTYNDSLLVQISVILDNEQSVYNNSSRP